jgi:hypothetical protein
MTVNVYTFYQSDVVPNEVTSCIEKYRKFRTLLLIKKVLMGKVLYDSALLKLMASFTAAVVALFFLTQFISHPFAGIMLFFSVCLYGSLFLRTWDEYARKASSPD